MPAMNKIQEKIVRSFRLAYFVFLIFGALITVTALIDVFWGMNWGYKKKDILIAVGLMSFATLVYRSGVNIFRSIGVSIILDRDAEKCKNED
jgi:small-conductance mechanosensitive channel